MDRAEVPRTRPAATPHKAAAGATPLKTPLRTPLRAIEQTSSTPITPFEAIESQKENVQPRARGRSAHALSATLSMQHKERQEMLATQRREHEEAVTSEANADADDPLEAWCAYVKWVVDNYPQGKSSESGIVPLLERATRTFRDSEQYRNDSRYLRLWILYAQHTDVPRDVFNFLLANEIGTKLAALYEELAHVLEELGVYDEADATFKLGIARRVSPLDRLKRRYAAYQERVLALPEGASSGADTYSKALAAAMARNGRSILGTKTGPSTSAPTNVLGAHRPISSAVRPNARTMDVYRDENDDGPQAATRGGAWTDLGTAHERRKENDRAPRHLAPLARAALTPRTQARLEVFCDSDEDEEHASPSRRTPQRDAVLRRSATSESDKLRKNPFLYYEQRKEAAPSVSEALAREEAPAKRLRREPSDRARHAEHAASERRHRHESRAHRAKRSSERHAAPLSAMYPALDMAAIVADKARPIPLTTELCYEELQARRRLPSATALDGHDPWAHLDALVGRWLPEASPRPVRRAPSPTVVTRAAMAEVDIMFNGSDEESESESDESSEADAAEPVYYRAAPQDENDGVQPTPRRAAPVRRAFGETPLRSVARREASDAEDAPEDPAVAPRHDALDEEEPVDPAVLAPRVPFQPLTPITERTESSRWTGPREESEASGEWEAPSSGNVAVGAADGDAAAAVATTASSVPVGGLCVPPSALDFPNPCSPADPDVIAALLNNLAMPVSSLPGYIDAHAEPSAWLATLRRHVGEEPTDYEVELGGARLAVEKRLGEGGFGTVFLAQDMGLSVPMPGETAASYGDIADDDDDELERRQALALKVESPPNPWEFYVLEQLRARLTPSLRPSVVGARRFVAHADESLLLLEYAPRGTLLQLVNSAGTAGVGSVLGAGAGGLEEVLAMFYVIELLRVVEGLHDAGILHGDLKIDNCMIRLDDAEEWTATYAADGSGGWAAKGVMLIDFGRAIDLWCFPAEQRFLSDWTPGAQDCAEMHECRPWTYQADYFGLASIAYCLLFGRYIETTSSVVDGVKTYRIQQPLRRYWQTELWKRCFHLLLNPAQHGTLPVTPALAELRHDMEAWLAAHSFHAGKNLRGLLKKVEAWALRL